MINAPTRLADFWSQDSPRQPQRGPKSAQHLEQDAAPLHWYTGPLRGMSGSENFSVVQKTSQWFWGLLYQTSQWLLIFRKVRAKTKNSTSQWSKTRLLSGPEKTSQWSRGGRGTSHGVAGVLSGLVALCRGAAYAADVWRVANEPL